MIQQRPNSAEILVLNPHSLTSLLDAEGFLSMPHGEIRLDLPVLSAGEIAEWEARLGRLYNECGCAAGAIGFASTSVCVLVVLCSQSGGILATSRSELGLALLAVFAATVLGKWFGVWRARVGLRRAVAELGAVIKSKKK